MPDLDPFSLNPDPDEPIPTRSTWGDLLLLWGALAILVAVSWFLISLLAYTFGRVLGWW